MTAYARAVPDRRRRRRGARGRGLCQRRDARARSTFREIERDRKVVIHHVSQPRYLLTITLEAIDGGGTRVRWEQAFEDPRVASGVEHIVVPANEQNLDRLSAEVLLARERG